MSKDAHSLAKSFEQTRPLLICDVDEVVLHFVAPFEAFLADRNARLNKRSFKLSGNIIDLPSGNAYSLEDSGELIQQFHRDAVDKQPIVEGAVKGLLQLSSSFQIVFLTNVSAELVERRRQHLASVGADFPVLQNEGSKAQLVKILCEKIAAPVVFVDDLPSHHVAIKATEPRVNCLHFMADPDFRSIVSFDPQIGQKAENWPQLVNLCEMLLKR